MCSFLKENNGNLQDSFQEANEDIKSYKVVKQIKDKWYAPFINVEYPSKELVISSLRLPQYIDTIKNERIFEIKNGLHSFVDKDDAIKCANFCASFSPDENEIFCVVESIIPKGSFYYNAYSSFKLENNSIVDLIEPTYVSGNLTLSNNIIYSKKSCVHL